MRNGLRSLDLGMTRARMVTSSESFVGFGSKAEDGGGANGFSIVVLKLESLEATSDKIFIELLSFVSSLTSEESIGKIELDFDESVSTLFVGRLRCNALMNASAVAKFPR